MTGPKTETQFLVDVKSLRDEVLTDSNSIQRILETAAQAKTEATEARKRIDACLDSGDERGFSVSMKALREKNHEVAKNLDSLKACVGKITVFRERHAALGPMYRQMKDEADANLKKAQVAAESVESIRGRVQGLLSEINGLERNYEDASDQTRDLLPEPV